MDLQFVRSNKQVTSSSGVWTTILTQSFCVPWDTVLGIGHKSMLSAAMQDPIARNASSSLRAGVISAEWWHNLFLASSNGQRHLREKEMMVKREVARKNAAICKREASTFSLSSPSCLKENQWESQLNSYLRMKTSDEEVYEEGPPRALQTGVKEWLDGGKKRHAQAQVWCTSVTQNRYGWPGNQLSSLIC